MDTFKNVADSIKEISFDLLGFLIPGILTISYLLFAIDKNITNSFESSILLLEFQQFIFLIISYTIGYFIMGISLFKNDILTKIGNCLNKYNFSKKHFAPFFSNYQDTIELKINGSKIFSEALEKYKKTLNEQNYSLKTRELRTRVMSFIPEGDNKIYSFRFRSDLCEHVNIVLFFLSIVFIILATFFKKYSIVYSGPLYVSFYLAVLLLTFFLRKTRNRYYDISIRIPFSIFLSKK